MELQDVRPYLGKACRLRLRCRACRGGHMLVGRVNSGRHLGDLVVDGQTFSVEDIEAIWRHRPPGGRRPTGIARLLLVGASLGSR